MSSPGGAADLSFLLDFQPKLTGLDSLVGEIQKLTNEVHMTMLQEAIEVIPTLAEVPAVGKSFGQKLMGSLSDMIKGGGIKTLLGGVIGGDIAGTVGAATGMGGEATGELIGGMFGAAGGPIGAAIGAAVGAAIGDVIKKVSDTIWSGMQLASPALMKQFQIAIEDVQAVIGEAFLPVLELATEGVRLFGDIIATIIPDADEMRGAIAPLIDIFDDLKLMLREVIGDIGPLIRNTFIAAIYLAATALKMLYVTLKPLLMFLMSPLMLLGLQFGGQGGMRSSAGAAARPAAITGIEEYQKQLQTQAYSMPGRQGHNLQEDMVEWLADIWEALTDPAGLGVKIIAQMVERTKEVIQSGLQQKYGITPGMTGAEAREQVLKKKLPGLF